MTEVRETGVSCGVNQIVSLHDLKKREPAFREFVEELWDRDQPDPKGGKQVYIFSDADRYGNGEWFMRMIRKYKLGKVTRPVHDNRNPGTGNQISVYVWSYNGKHALTAKQQRAS
jgi:hypothetical protein